MTRMSIPIIFYHALFEGKDDDNNKYSLSADVFRRHVKYLLANGFSTTSLAELSGQRFLDDGRKKLIISFDDGHMSDYLIAYPILKEHGLKATFFITAGWIGTQGYVGWQDLKEMSAAGMEIASHSLTHGFLSDLSGGELERELKGSKEVLEGGLGRLIEHISLPGGFCSTAVLDVAMTFKYRGVCTSVPGLGVKTSEEGFCVFDRLLITRRTSFEEFKKLVNADMRHIAFLKAGHYLKNSVRKTLGSKAYYALWSTFFKKA